MKIHIVTTQWSSGMVAVAPTIYVATAQEMQDENKAHGSACQWSTIVSREIETPQTSAGLRRLLDLLDDEDVMICDKVAHAIENMEDALHTELGIEPTPIPKKTFEVEAYYLTCETKQIEAASMTEAVEAMSEILKSRDIEPHGSMRVEEVEE